jgi:hypothetical protein
MKKEEKAVNNIIEALKDLGEKVKIEADQKSLRITIDGDWRGGHPSSRPKSD